MDTKPVNHSGSAHFAPDPIVDGLGVEAVKHHLERGAERRAARATSADVVDAPELGVDVVQFPELGPLGGVLERRRAPPPR